MNRSASVRISEVIFEDWDVLFSAVKAKFRLIVGEPIDAAREAPLDDKFARMQAGVLECVAALELMHTTIRNEIVRRQRPLRMLDQAGTQLRGMAVLYLHLDGLDEIGDAHGQDAVDQLLNVVAARMMRLVRGDDTVSCLEANEFGCLLQHLPGNERLRGLADEVLDAVSAPVKIVGDLVLRVRPSIGMARWRDERTTTQTLLGQANAALQRARREQTGCALFDEAVDVPAGA
jgi:diguanylate cyclase (GGDEF)-like protein